MRFTSEELDQYLNVIEFKDGSIFAGEEVGIIESRKLYVQGKWFRGPHEEGITSVMYTFLAKPLPEGKEVTAGELMRLPAWRHHAIVIFPETTEKEVE